MKVLVKTPNIRFAIPIIIPISVIKILINYSGRIINKYVTDEEALKYINSLDWNELYNAFDELKKYKGFEIVNLRSCDGVHVRVII